MSNLIGFLYDCRNVDSIIFNFLSLMQVDFLLQCQLKCFEFQLSKYLRVLLAQSLLEFPLLKLVVPKLFLLRINYGRFEAISYIDVFWFLFFLFVPHGG